MGDHLMALTAKQKHQIRQAICARFFGEITPTVLKDVGALDDAVAIAKIEAFKASRNATIQANISALQSEIVED